jgi:peptidoglycan/xylan/chitin deacetylase (PgdA/CDA1 family)
MGLAVAPDRFRDQLTLARRRTIPGDGGICGGAGGRRPATSAVASFDDSYRDNLTNAAPLLEEAAAPAGVPDRGRNWTPFWWDELARIVLLQPERIRSMTWRWGLPASLGISLPWGRQGPDPHGAPGMNPDRTRAAYRELWRHLQRCQPADRTAAMAELRQAVPVATADPDDLPMTVEEVAKLVSFQVSIGSHAMSHQPLTSLSHTDRRTEIEVGRAICVGLAGQPIDGFAFPHGDRDAETIAMVREAGFAWACSTRAASVDPTKYDCFDLPRIVAADVSGRAILNRIEEATP